MSFTRTHDLVNGPGMMCESLITDIFILSPVQTDVTLLDITCCVRFHTLLRVVAPSLKPVKLLATYKRTQQLPTLLAQQCC